MNRFGPMLAVSVLAIAATQSSAAQAQPTDNELCFNGAVEDANVAGCTRLIDAKALRGGNLTRVIGRRCLLYSRRGEIDNAFAACDEVVRRESNAAWAMALRGAILVRKGELERAAADIKEALALDPKGAGSHSANGQLLLARKDVNGALAAFNEAIGLNPNNGYLMKNRGLAHEAKGDIEHALADFNAALKLDPDRKEQLGRESADGLARIAGAYSDRGDEELARKEYDKAIADYGMAAKIAPHAAAPALVSLGYALQLKGANAQAIESFDTALKLDPQNAYAFYNRGSAKLAAGDAAGGNADIAQAKKIDPKIGK